ncbi:hypothetical protein ACFQV8_39450 [Pseudonocardia benzenivorans]
MTVTRFPITPPRLLDLIQAAQTPIGQTPIGQTPTGQARTEEDAR